MAEESISVTVDSELMKNHSATSAVAAKHGVRMLQDQDGNPLIFTIGGNQVLYLTCHSPDSATGWRQIDLSASLGGGLKVVSFQASQDKQGAIRLAVAAHKAGAENDHKLYLTPDLGNDHRSALFSGKPGWVARPFAEGSIRIAQILLGTSDDGQGAPLTIVALKRGDKAEYFTVNANVRDTSWIWNPYPLPQNVSEPLDMALGTVQGVRGTYGLYRTATGLSLTFTTLPDSRQPGSTSYDFPIPSGVSLSSIAALPPRSFFEDDDEDDEWFDGVDLDSLSYDLYAAGQGVYLFLESRTGKAPVEIAAASELDQAKSLHVEQDEKHVAIWVLQEKSRLLQYILGTAQDPQMAWTAPLPLRRGVTQMSAIRNRGKIANELVLAESGDDALVHLWQDPLTSTWQESSVPLENTRGVEEFDSYTSVVRFRDKSGMPILSGKVKISSSDWTRATINGVACSLGSDSPVEVAPDVQGGVTIIQKADNIQTPLLSVQADFLPAKTILVNPAQKIFQGMGRVRSGGDLKQQKGRDGKPLLTSAISDQTLEQAAQVISQLANLGSQLVPAGMGRRADGAIRADSLPSDYEWGVRFDSRGQPSYQAGTGRLVSGKANRQANIGDFLETLAQGLVQVGAVVFKTLVEGGQKFLQVVFEVAGKVFEFLLSSVGQVLESIAWFLQEVLHIDLSDILRWLGQLFDWEEIKATQQVMVDMVNRVLDYGAGGLDKFRDQADRFFERAIADVKKLRPDAFPPQARQLRVEAVRGSATSKVPVGDFDQTPMGSWPQYQILHGGFLDSGASKLSGPDIIMRFFEDSLTGFAKAVDQAVQGIVKDLAFAFKDGTLTPDQVLAALGGDALVGLLEALRSLTHALLKLLADLVRLIKQVINQDLQIPVISALYEGIYSGSDALSAPYRKLSLLNAIAFVVAIPTTWIYKAVSGRAPFGSGIQSGRQSQYDQLFQGLPALSS